MSVLIVLRMVASETAPIQTVHSDVFVLLVPQGIHFFRINATKILFP
jgi:hypothetical protein